MGDVSTKLLDARQDAARAARLAKMRDAWREWRGSLVATMNDRITNAGTEPDAALAALEAEYLHLVFVSTALARDPEEIWIGNRTDNGGEP
jgi:hypothetical protein